MLRCITDDGKLNPLLVQFYRSVGGLGVKRVRSDHSPAEFVDLFHRLSEVMRVNKTRERPATMKEVELLKRLGLFDEVRVESDAPISGFALFSMQPQEFARTLHFFGTRMNKFEFSELLLLTRNALFSGDGAIPSSEFEHEPFKQMVLGQSWIARTLEKKETQFIHMKIRGTEVWWNERKLNVKALFDAYLDYFSRSGIRLPKKVAFLCPQPMLQVVRAYAQQHHPDLTCFFAGPEASPKAPIDWYLTAVRQMLEFELQAAPRAEEVSVQAQ